MTSKRGEGAAKPITHSTGYPNRPDTVMLAQLMVSVPMTFEKVEQLPHLTGYCQRCSAVLGKIVWVAHSTPYLKWETDSAYGEFILCESCGDKAALEASSPSALIAAVEADKRIRSLSKDVSIQTEGVSAFTIYMKNADGGTEIVELEEAELKAIISEMKAWLKLLHAAPTEGSK